MVEQLSAEYEGRITFLTIAARSSAEDAAAGAAAWIPSGRVMWAFDEPEELWQIFGIRGTPTSVVLTSDHVMVNGWAGEIGEAGLREAFDAILAET